MEWECQGGGVLLFCRILNNHLFFFYRDTAKFFTFDQDHLHYIKGQDNCFNITLKKTTQPCHQTASQWQQHDLKLRNGWLKWPTHPQCFYWGGGGGGGGDSGISFLQNPCRFSHKMPTKHVQQFPLILQLSFQLHKELVHYHTILQQLTRLCPRDLIPQTPPPILLLHKTVSAGCSDKKIIYKKKSTATCGQHYETKIAPVTTKSDI